MKKFACFVLALTMVFSLGISASAAEIFDSRPGKTPGTPADGSENWQSKKNVSVTVTAPMETKVYYVEVTWQEMEFTYTFGDKTWDPTNHSYTEDSGKWDVTPEAKITVANHSNAAVSVQVVFDNGTANVENIIPGVDGVIEDGNFNLDPATEGSLFSAAPTKSATLRLNNKPTNRTETTVTKGVHVIITG